MNKMKFMVLFMSITMIFSGCASMNNTGKGAAIGGGSGAALGAIPVSYTHLTLPTN